MSSLKPIKKLELEQRIHEYFYEVAPNSVLSDLLYEEFKRYERKDIDVALESLKIRNVITNSIAETNHMTVIAQGGSFEREKLYLKNYPNRQDYPYKSYIEIGNLKLPRMLAGETMHGEDVNHVFKSLAYYTNNLKKELEQELEEQSNRFYKQIISIFGVFVSVFALIVISADKLISLDVNALKDQSFWSLFRMSLGLFAPTIILVLVLVGIVWWIACSNKK